MGQLPNGAHYQEQTAQQVQALLGEQYCSSSATVFYVESRSFIWSDHGVTIFNGQGKHMYTMENKAWRIRGNKVLKSVEGRSICSLREKVFSWNSIWTITKEDTAGQECIIGTFTRELGSANDGVAMLVGHKGAEFSLQARPRWSGFFGSWLAQLFQQTEYDIMQQGKVVGQVSETFDRYILWKHSYKVTVNPGYDHAFLLCLVIIMEVYNPRHKHSFGSPQIAEGPREHSSSAKSGEPHMSKTAENQNATGVAASKPL